jgi:hypothetical protein
MFSEKLPQIRELFALLPTQRAVWAIGGREPYSYRKAFPYFYLFE